MQPNSSDGEPDPQSESQPQPKSQASEPQEQQDKWFWEHTLYDELRKLAAAKMAQEQVGETLQPTALVHEAYLRLVKFPESQSWNGRGHFFGAAAEAMRRILIENARRKKRQRQAGQAVRVELEDAHLVTNLPPDQLLVLSDAIDVLAAHDQIAADLIKLSYFAGLSVEQAAHTLGVARSTAYEHWAYGRAWLFARLRGVGEGKYS